MWEKLEPVTLMVTVAPKDHSHCIWDDLQDRSQNVWDEWIIYTPKQIQGPGFEITECPFNTHTEWNWSSYPMWSKTVTNDVAGFTLQCVIDERSRWFSATERKIKPVGLSVEKQETLLCKMFELKRNRFFWIFSLWAGDDISNILRAVTDPMPKNNTDNLIQHLIK